MHAYMYICRAVLKQFISEFNFTGMTLVAALRTFFQAFMLPGEAQQIDQIVQVSWSTDVTLN